MAIPLGEDFKLYRNTGTVGVPVWSEMICVDDLALDPGNTQVNIRCRGKTGSSALQGRRDAVLTAKVWWDSADANNRAVIDAAWDRSSLHLAVADGDITVSGTLYNHAELIVTSAPHDFSFGEGASLDAEFKEFASGTVSFSDTWFVVP